MNEESKQIERVDQASEVAESSGSDLDELICAKELDIITYLCLLHKTVQTNSNSRGKNYIEMPTLSCAHKLRDK